MAEKELSQAPEGPMWLLFCALEDEHRQRTGHEKSEKNGCSVCQIFRMLDQITDARDWSISEALGETRDNG